MRTEIEDEMNKYFQKKFGKATEQGVSVLDLYQIIAKPQNVDMESSEIQSIVGTIFQSIMSSNSEKFSDINKLYNHLKILCKYCKEDEYYNEVVKLWERGTIGLSIPDLQRKIIRGGKVPLVNGKRISFDRLYFSFKSVEGRLIEIFYDVRFRNNIKVPFNMSDVLGSIGKNDM